MFVFFWLGGNTEEVKQEEEQVEEVEEADIKQVSSQHVPSGVEGINWVQVPHLKEKNTLRWALLLAEEKVSLRKKG